MNSAATTRTSSAAVGSHIDHAAKTEWLAGTTKFGKPIIIRRQKAGTGFEIVVGGGGVRPPALDGTFTSLTYAKDAVRGYMLSVHYDLDEKELPDFTEG